MDSEDLRKAIEERLSEYSQEDEDTIASIVEAFCKITPSEVEHRIYDITFFDKGFDGGVSRKPGNVFLNWRQLIKKIPEIGLAGKEISEGTIFAIFAALQIWSIVISTSTIKLSDKHATVLYVMWVNCNKDHKIAEGLAYEKTKAHLEQTDKAAEWLIDFSQVVDDLVRMKCIELQEGIVWLREWIRKPLD